MMETMDRQSLGHKHYAQDNEYECHPFTQFILIIRIFDSEAGVVERSCLRLYSHLKLNPSAWIDLCDCLVQYVQREKLLNNTSPKNNWKVSAR